jgi:uroporphyrinogen decarboxylase
MSFEPVDRTLMWESGYWIGAVRRWYREGLPRHVGVPEWAEEGNMVSSGFSPVNAPSFREDHPSHGFVDGDVRRFFGLDEVMVSVPLNYWLYPAFEPEILEDHGEWVLQRTANGIIERNRRDRSGFPGWVRGPVANREDWEQVKGERLRPELQGRVPEDWPTWVAEFRERTYALSIGGCPAGFYGALRHLLGQEQVLMAFYDEPELVQDIIDHLVEFWVTLYDRALSEVDVDMAFIWEDMCYKNGPLISPAMFRRFMLPAYKKLTGCLRDHGVPVIMVDTDGNFFKLTALFMEGGVNVLSPCEVNAGMDVVELREAFPRLGIMGGIDKQALAAGREAIDAELEAKVPFMLDRGGFVPGIDHEVPPGVSWDNFRYYREKLNAMIRQ